MFTNRHGLPALLKDGYRTFTGIDEVTAKNVEACKTLCDITKTSLGPNGLGKLIVTSFSKKYVTNDTASILHELEVQHPAAKLLVMAAEMQKQEMGGGCGFLLVIAGQLLTHADYLLRQGLHLNDIIRGYEFALERIPSYYEDATALVLDSLKDPKQLERVLNSVLASKPLCAEANLSSLVASAVSAVMPPNPKDFDTENVRVAKLQGGRLAQSTVVNGMVVTRPPHGTVESKGQCKVMVLGCGLEFAATEAKGTVLLHNADELKNFTKGEEGQMEDTIRKIKDAGVEAIIVHGGAIADLAQHYCDKYEILTLKVQSKFEARRICRALGATALVRLGVPMADELGVATSIQTLEISSTRVTQILCRDTRVQTVVVRGSTPCLLDEAEKAVADACSLVKAATKDAKFVVGGGAVEMEVARKLQASAEKLPGVEQYAVLKAAEAFETIPRILAETAGLNATEALAALHAAHAQGRRHEGVNVEAYGSPGVGGNCESESDGSKEPATMDAEKAGIFDHTLTKVWAVRLAFDAAITVLRVDQIIMARPAGGPAPRAPGAPDLD